MASAQQLIGLVKSHAEGDERRFFDLAMQLAAAEEQKGHVRLADQLRQWADAGLVPQKPGAGKITPIAAPRGDLGAFLSAGYPETRLNDLIVPPRLFEELRHVVDEMRMRERLEEKGLRPRRRLLFAGPPGTGKSLSAQALAGELKFPLFTVLLHGLITKFMGETAQKLRMVFDAVRTTRGVYLFDEIDALAAARGGENDVGEARRILNSFLQFLDEDTGPSLVVATTNLPEILDRAILRRFDLVLAYEMPGPDAIETALRRRLRGFNTDTVNWPEAVDEARDLSTADIVAAGEDAARRAVLQGSGEIIETEALVASLRRRRSLNNIGMGVNAEGQKALRAQRHRVKSRLSAASQRRIRKASQ